MRDGASAKRAMCTVWRSVRSCDRRVAIRSAWRCVRSCVRWPKGGTRTEKASGEREQGASRERERGTRTGNANGEREQGARAGSAGKRELPVMMQGGVTARIDDEVRSTLADDGVAEGA